MACRLGDGGGTGASGMQVRWFADAVLDLIGIRDYIAKERPKTANDIAQLILENINVLKRNPGIGRPGRIPNTKELIIAGTPYIVPYRVKGGIIEILRVLHGAMRWPEDLP
ncbi:Death on curing protein, Doc toxin [hydrothermal vent metagenome]|uniref:Death on curing protein, Doc toxin n=2 Tax=hydrothermal vent metagenome TaxID=652676 RepID=A0A3B1D942_9ZZZZ